MIRIYLVFITFFNAFYILNGQQAHYNELKIQFDHFQQVEKFDSALMVAKDLNELALRFETDTSLIYAVSLRYVGDCYENLEIVDSAFIYWNKSLEILIKQNRSDGLDAAECFNNLGTFYFNKEDYKMTELFYKKSLEVRVKNLGEVHLDVAANLDDLGELYYELGAFKNAEPFLKQALEIRRNILGMEHLDFAESLDNLSAIYYELDDFKTSEDFLKLSLEVKKKTLGNDHPDIAYSLENFGILYSKMRAFKLAESFYKESLEIYRKIYGEINLSVAESLENLGNLSSNLWKHDTAKILLMQSLEIKKEVLGKDHPDVAAILKDIGVLYYDLGEYKTAETLLMKSLEIIKKVFGEENPAYASNLSTLGALYFEKGYYKTAEDFYKQSLEIYKKSHGEDQLNVAALLSELGGLYFYLGAYKTAEDFYKQSLEIYKKSHGENHPYFATLLNDLGNLYSETGNFKTAEAFYKQSLQIFKKSYGEEHPDVATNLGNLAGLYSSLGDYKTAETYYKQALDIQKKAFSENQPSIAIYLNNLGTLYSILGAYKFAEPLLKESLEVLKNALGEFHPDVATNLGNLAGLYSSLGNYKTAETYYKQALDIRKKALGEFHPDVATNLGNLGVLYFEKGDYKMSEIYLKLSLELKKKIYNEFNNFEPTILVNLGDLYTTMGEFNTAEQYYKESFKIKLENINSGFSWLSANEKIAYWNQENKFFFDLGYFSYKAWKELNSSTELTYNASLISKSLLLETSRELEQAISNSSDEVMKNQFKEMKQLLKFYNKIQSEGAANKEMALNYKRQADSLDKILVNKLGVYADSKRKFKITWKDVQSNLGSTEAAIEFVRFYKDSLFNYMALVVRPEYEYPKLVKLGDEVAIQAAVQTKDYASLYNLAWKGIDSLLEGVQRVYYSPSGELNNVSFSAICLQSGNDLVISSQNANRGMIIGSKITIKTDCKTVLMDKYELHQLTSTRYLADGTLQKEKTIKQSLVILGGVNYDETPEQSAKEEKEQSNEDYALVNNLKLMVNRNSTNYGKRMEYLSGTKEEVIIIENLLNNSKWKVQARSDKSAGEYEFKKEMESKSPGVLHIATHGFAFPEEIKKEGKMTELNQTSTYKIAEDPMVRCGLMLSGSNISWTGNPQRMIEQTGDDGILTAAEVANMALSNTKLVVLSACETGLGKIEGSEGTFGLKRGFKLAGVEQLIVSLWSVPDKETMELMTLFYSDLTQSLNPVSSFEKAQKEMRLKYPTDLEKWAGFVLVR